MKAFPYCFPLSLLSDLDMAIEAFYIRDAANLGSIKRAALSIAIVMFSMYRLILLLSE